MVKKQYVELFGKERRLAVDPELFLPLTTASLHILLALAGGERHGYAILQEVRDTSEGMIKLGPGTLYRSLRDLLEDDLIEESTRRPGEAEDERRRYYRLTDFGRRVLSLEARRLANVLMLARARKLLPGPQMEDTRGSS
jgi:DNA-binding PadR family transcriptional regulator